MGKYMRKSKTSAELALMDVSPSSLGVRTRARTLALQLQQQRVHRVSSPSPSPSPSPLPPPPNSSYLQLRNRRLLKPTVPTYSKRPKHLPPQRPVSPVQSPSPSPSPSPNPNPNPNFISSPATTGRASTVNSGSAVDDFSKGVTQSHVAAVNCREAQDYNHDGTTVEASFGENVLDSNAKGRSTRESTPCSLIKNPDSIQTPGSTTKPVAEATRRSESSMRRHFPTAHEVDEFFACAEEEQQKHFIEKYNFDPVNEKPLPGPYEWEMLG